MPGVKYTGRVVNHQEVPVKTNRYWGYRVRVAKDLKEALQGDYDLRVGMDDNSTLDP